MRRLGTSLALMLSLLSTAATAGEFFTVRMPSYFVEIQGGNRVDLVLTIEYDGVLPQARMPDYRIAQILAEDTLYSVPDPLTFWELTNREIVRRILVAFPQIRWVESKLTVNPRDALSVRRFSRVAWSQADLPKLGVVKDFVADRYREARPDTYNVLVPRCLKESIEPLRKAFAEGKDGVVVDLAPYPLEGTDESYAALFRLLRPNGLYDALILPESAKHELSRVRGAGTLRGILLVHTDTPAAENQPPVVETSLGMTLGLDPARVAFARLGDARENFFYYKRQSGLVVEARYAFPYTSRGFKTEPYLAGAKLALFAPKLDKRRSVPAALDKALDALR